MGEIELSKTIISMPPSIAPIAFKLDILGALKPALMEKYYHLDLLIYLIL